MKSKSLIIFLTLISVIFLNREVNSCSSLLVTKGASKDGSTMITYTADAFNLYGELYYFPAAKYPEGTMLDIYEWDTGKFLGKIKQARETFNVVGNMNEYQLVISESTFGGRKELIDPKGILDYGSLIYITLQRAKTAREAIQIMTDLVAEYGYYSSGESFSIADPHEVWMMEMIGKGPGNKGANWVAIRIPDGYVAGHANHSRITKFALNDPENVIYSKDIIQFARQQGFFKGKDSDFSFSDAFAPLEFSLVRFCDARVWSMFRRINADADKYISYIRGESLERMPLYIKPDRKLSVEDVMSLKRDHYQGTELDMTIGVAAGPYKMPYRWRPLIWEHEGQRYFNERPLSTPQTAFSFVSQSRSWLPREIGGLLWWGVDDTYFTVYTPLYASMTRMPPNSKQGLGSLSKFTWESAFWVFNFVANFSYPKYSIIIDDVVKVRNELEGTFLARQKEVEDKALALSKSSSREATEFLNNYSLDMAAKAYKRWRELGEFLILKYVDGIVKNEYFQPVNVGYPDEFKDLMIKNDGDRLKMRQVPGENDWKFNDIILKADKLVSEKKYQDAKKSFESALKLKPNEVYPKEQIEKIDAILKEIDGIHGRVFAK